MARFNHTFSSFRRGALGPKFAGQISREEYYESVKDLKNFNPLRSGAIERRGGLNRITSSAKGGSYFFYSPTSKTTGEFYVIDGIRVARQEKEGRTVLRMVFRETFFTRAGGYLRGFNSKPRTQDFGFFLKPEGVPVLDNLARNDIELRGLLLDNLQYVQIGNTLHFADSSGEFPPFFIEFLPAGTPEFMQGRDMFGSDRYSWRVSIHGVETLGTGRLLADNKYAPLFDSPRTVVNTQETALRVPMTFSNTNTDNRVILAPISTNDEGLIYNFGIFFTVDFNLVNAPPNLEGELFKVDFNTGTFLTNTDKPPRSYYLRIIGQRSFTTDDTTINFYEAQFVYESMDDFIDHFTEAQLGADKRGLRLATQIVERGDTGNFVLRSTNVNVDPNFFETTDYSFQEWGNNRGWPRAVGAHKQRLVYGGTKVQPSTLWFSYLGNVEVFYDQALVQDLGDKVESSVLSLFKSGRTKAQDSFSYSVFSDQSSEICWMVGTEGLIVGTNASQWLVRGDDNDALTGLSIQANKMSSVDSNAVQAIQAGSVVYFVNGAGDSVKAMVPQRSGGSLTNFAIDDLNKFNDTIFAGDQIKDLKWSSKENRLYCLTDNGRLATYTLDERSQMGGWSEVVLGGEALVESVLISESNTFLKSSGLGSPSLGVLSDSVFLDHFIHAGGLDVRLDAATSVDIQNVSDEQRVIDYLAAHLNVSPTKYFVYVPFQVHKKIIVVQEGYSFEAVVRSSENRRFILLDDNSPAIIGLPFESSVETYAVAAERQGQVSIAYMKRIDQVALQLFRSLQCQVSTDTGRFDDVRFRDYVQRFGRALSFENSAVVDPSKLFTGVGRTKVEDRLSEEAGVRVKTSSAYPLTIASITARGEAQD